MAYCLCLRSLPWPCPVLPWPCPVLPWPCPVLPLLYCRHRTAAALVLTSTLPHVNVHAMQWDTSCVYCRLSCWWEQSALQLKLLALLLVIVNGKPLGGYLQILMVLCIFILELLYQMFWHPYCFAALQLIQVVTVAVIIF